MNIIISEHIINGAKKGDRMAMQQMYSLTARYLYAVCQRYVANDEDTKDVLQESYIKIFHGITDFRPQGQGSMLSWMSRIVTNESLMYLRNKKHFSFIEAETDLPDMEEELDIARFSPEELHHAITQLPTGYRAVLNLYTFEDKSHKKIGQMLGIKESTSASQLNRAKHLLRKILIKREGESL